ncbi:hypothetical protein CC1G_13001 [Coprinopsis cinerea okayama7|uniref:Uncharacterized protein n=1 Tax=Coprinopsis cinerea (strain Okayama-7 / 130 / ATCC MYA-4618 / FGSC 9003) TaxID=240176 RepID=A8P6W6_COPC7|nr:hypothetical protein CC1G_13001 [Coprinopsis cinerea okayama7\|eukprot:XP_001839243.2 hypothetical protein CC1G_13001 [Coprinopsis cinerea okayama7\
MAGLEVGRRLRPLRTPDPEISVATSAQRRLFTLRPQGHRFWTGLHFRTFRNEVGSVSKRRSRAAFRSSVRCANVDPEADSSRLPMTTRPPFTLTNTVATFDSFQLNRRRRVIGEPHDDRPLFGISGFSNPCITPSPVKDVNRHASSARPVPQSESLKSARAMSEA